MSIVNCKYNGMKAVQAEFNAAPAAEDVKRDPSRATEDCPACRGRQKWLSHRTKN